MLLGWPKQHLAVVSALNNLHVLLQSNTHLVSTRSCEVTG